jgi:hypothetical protein
MYWLQQMGQRVLIGRLGRCIWQQALGVMYSEAGRVGMLCAVVSILASFVCAARSILPTQFLIIIIPCKPYLSASATAPHFDGQNQGAD